MGGEEGGDDEMIFLFLLDCYGLMEGNIPFLFVLETLLLMDFFYGLSWDNELVGGLVVCLAYNFFVVIIVVVISLGIASKQNKL